MNHFMIEVPTSAAQTSLLHDIELACTGQNEIKADTINLDGAFFVSVSYPPQTKETVILAAAGSVCAFILREREKEKIKKILEQNYGYFTAGEKSTIFNIAFIDAKSLEAKKEAITRIVKEYMASEDHFSVDGLLNFRMQDYLHILEYTIDQAVEKYLADREYEEFLSLLRFFVSVQESKMDVLNVVVADSGEYKLYNERKEEITNKCYIEFFKEYPYGSIRSDDFLISTMINLSPKNIVIHREELMQNSELKNTIRKVFSDRIQTCSGCSLCRQTDGFIQALDSISQKPLLFQ